MRALFEGGGFRAFDLTVATDGAPSVVPHVCRANSSRGTSSASLQLPSSPGGAAEEAPDCSSRLSEF